MWIAKNNDLIILAKDTMEELEQALQFMVYTDIEETEEEYQLYNGNYLTPEEVKEQEKVRISNLQVTKRVFALGLKQFNISYSQLKDLIATNEDAQLEWDLCVELQRKNPLLDVMGAELGVTPEILDYIFRRANGEDVEPPIIEENSVVEEEDDNTTMVE